jgi:hypothetical protein
MKLTASNLVILVATELPSKEFREQDAESGSAACRQSCDQPNGLSESFAVRATVQVFRHDPREGVIQECIEVFPHFDLGDVSHFVTLI